MYTINCLKLKKPDFFHMLIDNGMQEIKVGKISFYFSIGKGAKFLLYL